MIGETTFQATARLDAEGKVGVKVTAITPYGNRSVSVSEDLSAAAIESNLANIKAHKDRIPGEIQEVTEQLQSSKLSIEDQATAQKNLNRLQQNLVRLDSEEAYFHTLENALDEHGTKIGAILAAVVKDLREGMESKAVREASRAITTALDKNEDLKGERTIVRAADQEEK